MQRWKGDYSLSRFRAKLADKFNQDPNVEPDYEEVYRPELGERIVVKRDARGSMGTLSSSSSAGALRSSLQGSSRLARSGASLSSSGRSGSLPSLRRDVSAPTLGVNRAQVAPACLNRSYSIDDNEKEKAASRQLWTAVNGSEADLKKHAAQMDQEKVPSTSWCQSMAKAEAKGMQKAMKNGAKVDWRNDDWDGATLLLKAVRSGQMEVAMWCLGNGADAMIADKSGRGILHWAALEGSPAMMEFVLTEAPDISPMQVDGGGDQPLHLAAFAGNLPVVRLLVQAQADPLATNSGGFLPLDLAKTKRMWHVARYLNEFKHLEGDRVTGVLTKGAQKFSNGAERVKQITQMLSATDTGSKSRFERTEREVKELLEKMEEDEESSNPLKLQKIASLQRTTDVQRKHELKIEKQCAPYAPDSIEDEPWKRLWKNPENEHLVGIRDEVVKDLKKLSFDMSETPTIKKLRENWAGIF